MPKTILRYVDFPSSLAAAGRTIEALEKDDAAEPLSIHTSAGTLEQGMGENFACF